MKVFIESKKWESKKLYKILNISFVYLMVLIKNKKLTKKDGENSINRLEVLLIFVVLFSILYH